MGKPNKKMKFVLMSSVAVSNPIIPEDDKRPCMDRMVVSMLRWVLPPHPDNESAASFVYDLGNSETQSQRDANSNNIEWCIVRPDELLEGDTVTEYNVVEKVPPSLFNGGETSRVNVAHFMADLVLKDDLWNKWVYRFPVPLNSPPSEAAHV